MSKTATAPRYTKKQRPNVYTLSQRRSQNRLYSAEAAAAGRGASEATVLQTPQLFVSATAVRRTFLAALAPSCEVGGASFFPLP